MKSVGSTPALKLRTVWLSDVHLGFAACKADFLLDFLRSVHAEHIYLLGDIIDVMSMERRLHWPPAHNAVLKDLIARVKRGTRVTYVPGNHDELFRGYDGLAMGSFSIRSRVTHTTLDGRRLLLMHGDEFDKVVQISPLLARIGSHAYEWLLNANRAVDWLRRKLGLPYWSLSLAAKRCVKRACHYISDYEQAVAQAARAEQADGVICGHIHHAAIEERDGFTYMNCGDWVENCTALVEHFDGRIELLRWTEARERMGVREREALPQAA